LIEVENLHQADQGERIEPENSQNRSQNRQISLDDRATDVDPTEGRGKHIQKETEYVRLLGWAETTETGLERIAGSDNDSKQDDVLVS
jgi:hypothetical protein